ncbi:MAG: hypothetical protein ABI621_19680 [Chloroflexota bacterium]
MKNHLIIVLFVLVSLLAGACSSVATSTPVSDLSGGYPLSTKTGVEVVDNVLAAVASGNTDELRSLIQYTTAPCTTADGLGGPPKCNEGEPHGQTLQVLPFLGSEGSFIRQNEIGNWDGIDATAVYAVYRVSEGARREEYYPPGEYAVIFLGPPNELGVSVRIGSKGIVRIDSLFDTSPEALKLVIERDASEVILAPKSR